MKKSKRTYIHNNFKNITVGIKGKKQFKISKEDLYNDIIKIQEKSRQLSEQYRKNAKFPIALYSTAEPVPFIKKSYSIILDITMNNAKNYKPEEVISAIKDIQKISKSDVIFNRNFYEEIKKYYGVSANQTIIKKVAKKGGFRIPKQDLGLTRKYYPESDPTRLQNWIIDNIDNVEENKVRNISDIDELNYLIQEYNITNVVPDEIKKDE